MRNVLPINTMAIALGLHPRCGNEDTLWGQLGEKLHLRRRRPPAGPHRRRARPRGRHRQGSPRHLPARRVLGQRRRGPGQARLPAQPQARPARLPPPRLIGTAYRPHDPPVRRCGPGSAGPAPAPPCRQRTTRSRSTPSVHPSPDGHRTSTSNRAMERRHGIAGHREQGRRHRRRPAPTQAPTKKARRLFPWVVFALTFALLLSDYMSRQVLSSVFPFLKLEWALTDTQLGGARQRRRADRRPCWPSRCRCSATAGAGSSRSS